VKGINVCGEGPAIVLLHSSLSSNKQWLGLVNLLKNHFTIINIDLLGYGNAEQVVDTIGYNFDVEVERILTSVQSVIGNDKFHLVGHSCGGAIALKMAVEIPDVPLSLSLFEPVAFHLFNKESEESKLMTNFTEQIDLRDNESAAEAFVDFWNGDGYFKCLPDKAKTLMTLGIDKVRLDFKGIMFEKYKLEQLDNIKVPSLFLFGKYSPKLSQVLSENIILNLPDVESHEIAAGHMAPLSHARLVDSLIADFLINRT